MHCFVELLSFPHYGSSGDSTARLWHVDNDISTDNSIVLSHREGGAQGHVTNEGGNNRDVTSVHWSVS